jgi:hypothetical protein
MRNRTIHLLTVLAAAIFLGCGSGRIENPNAGLPEGEDSAVFLSRIANQTTVSENQAMRGLLMLHSPEHRDAEQTFAARVDRLRSVGIIGPKWDVDAEKPITRGRLAYMIYQVTKMDGGVILTLAGPSERYCLRELQYKGFITDGAPYSPVSGMEYVAILSRADAYIRTGELPSPTSDYGP